MRTRIEAGSARVPGRSVLRWSARAAVAVVCLAPPGAVVFHAGVALAADPPAAPKGATPKGAAPKGADTKAPDTKVPDTGVSDDARARFQAGVNLLMDPEGPRYEEAYREFKAAYATSPSYRILGNLGLCAMKLERDDEAIAAYEKYLAEAKDLPPNEANQVRNDLETLKTGVAHVTLDSDPPGAKIVDVRVSARGDRLINDYGPLTAPTRLGMRQGSHQITAKIDGYPDQTWEIDLAGGQEVPTHKFVLTKPAVPESVVVAPGPAPLPAPVATTRPVPAGVWAGVAVTGALAVGTAVVGVLALKNLNDYKSQNDGSNPSHAQSLYDKGQTLDHVTDGLLAGAVVAGVVTAVLFFTRPAVAATTTTGDDGVRHTGLRVVPSFGREGSGLALSF